MVLDDDDTTHTLDRASMWSAGRAGAKATKSYAGVNHTNALDTNEIRMHGPLSV